jgi:hypothetical protein
MRLSEVIDDLYDRVLGCQDALQEDELPEWDEGEDIDSIPEPVYDTGDDDEDDEYAEEDGFPEDEE